MNKYSETKQQKYISDLRRNLITWKLGNTINTCTNKKKFSGTKPTQWKEMAKRIQAIVGGTALATAAIAGYVFANR